MNFLKNIKNKQDFISPKNLAKIAANFFGRYARAFIFLVALALTGFCIDLWYHTIYRSGWNDEQKQEYIKNKGQGVVFNEKGFEYDVSAMRARQAESQKDLAESTDIFRLEKSLILSAPKTSSPAEDSSTTSIIP